MNEQVCVPRAGNEILLSSGSVDGNHKPADLLKANHLGWIFRNDYTSDGPTADYYYALIKPTL